MPRPVPLVALAAIGLAFGCSLEPRARTVTGPDGSPMMHVACGKDQGACFELAGRGCPHGYKVFPIFDPRDNNFLIRCHAVRDMAAVPAESAPSPGAPVLGQGTPGREPWSSTNAGIASKPPPLTTGTTNDSEIDLGY